MTANVSGLCAGWIFEKPNVQLPVKSIIVLKSKYTPSAQLAHKLLLAECSLSPAKLG